MAISKRFPAWEQVAAVYAVIVVVIYSWTLLWFFWKYSGWAYFMNIVEIANILADSLTINLAESIVVLLAPLAAAVVLPQKWFRNDFVARGVALVLPVLAYMIYIAYQLDHELDYPSAALDWAPVVLLATLLLVFAVGRFSPLRKLLEAFADRTTVFLYLSIPVSLLAVVAVIVQLVF